MSVYKGYVSCPGCGRNEFIIHNWDTYLSVLCRWCHHKMGELPPRKES